MIHQSRTAQREMSPGLTGALRFCPRSSCGAFGYDFIFPEIQLSAGNVNIPSRSSIYT
jgi:hypothetical protein